MKRIKHLFSNIIVQYTIISLSVTLVIAFLLLSNMIKTSQGHSIKIHSKVYIDYIQSIPENYPSLITDLIEGKSVETSTTHNDHQHDSNSDNNDDLDHFITDLLIFPNLKEINIFSKDKQKILEYKNSSFVYDIKHNKDAVDKVFNGEILYFLHSIDNITLLHFFLPVFDNNKVIGVVEILDSDLEFTKYLDASKNSILKNIIWGGFVLYALLFTLFFKSYVSQKRTFKRLQKSQELTIYAMSLLAELRDEDTGSHIIRTKEYCKILAYELKNKNKYKNYLTKEYIEDLERSAPLHDIGKVGVPDNILLKPGKLTTEEFEIMKKHPEYGAKVLSTVTDKIDFKSYFTIGIQVILHHHENWDGTGYPKGLIGENIPLSARIMSIADVYDALRAKRPYKKAMSHIEAKSIIEQNSGIKFDPELVEAFINIESQFESISNSIID